MKRSATLTLIFLLVLSYSCSSQEYSYTHYDITDGLAGSVVYCIAQDKDGFIWTGTETGISRFDGTHFKSFSAADGLPDIEVLNMFGDSKGRFGWPLSASQCAIIFRVRYTIRIMIPCCTRSTSGSISGALLKMPPEIS